MPGWVKAWQSRTPAPELPGATPARPSLSSPDHRRLPRDAIFLGRCPGDVGGPGHRHRLFTDLVGSTELRSRLVLACIDDGMALGLQGFDDAEAVGWASGAAWMRT